MAEINNMGVKEYYFKLSKTVTTTTEQTGVITVQEDFTQFYDAVLEVSSLLELPTSLKLLLWLGKEMSEMNAIQVGKPTFDKYNDYLKSTCVKCSISRPTFDRSMAELLKHGLLTRVGKGFYYLNPHFLWKGSKQDRIQFLIDESKDGKTISRNPNDNKLSEPEVDYKIEGHE